jgi:uncharacterized protein (DUF1778 family)
MRTETTDSGYARLSCRVSARIKHQAEEAAALLGQSITDFTESALADKAASVIERHERITLSDRDFARFVAAIEEPESPTEALKAAVSAYRRQVKFPTASGL